MKSDEPGFVARTPTGDFDERSGAPPGTAGITAAMSAATLATVRVNASGLPDGTGEGRTPVTVSVGDSCGMSSDAPVPPGGDPLTGLGQTDVCETGAGRGRNGDHFPRHDWQQAPR